MTGFLFLWREVGPTEAIRDQWHRGVCRLIGHRWKCESHFESWDVGVGYRSFWWTCDRCEKFSAEDPA